MFLDEMLVFLGSIFAYVVVLIFLLAIMRQPTKRLRLLLFLESALAVFLARGFIAGTIHFLFPVARPFSVLGFEPLISASGASFPSGHASLFFALATVILFINKRTGIYFFGAAIVISVARIVIGVHWPLDVGFGIIVGILSGLIASRIGETARMRILLSLAKKPPETKETEETI